MTTDRHPARSAHESAANVARAGAGVRRDGARSATTTPTEATPARRGATETAAPQTWPVRRSLGEGGCSPLALAFAAGRGLGLRLAIAVFHRRQHLQLLHLRLRRRPARPAVDSRSGGQIARHRRRGGNAARLGALALRTRHLVTITGNEFVVVRGLDISR